MLSPWNLRDKGTTAQEVKLPVKRLTVIKSQSQVLSPRALSHYTIPGLEAAATGNEWAGSYMETDGQVTNSFKSVSHTYCQMPDVIMLIKSSGAKF